MKEWFESLDLNERILAVTTIDTKIAKNVKHMHHKLRKAGNDTEQGKYRMVTSTPPAITSLKITNLKDKTQVDKPVLRPQPLMQLTNS